MNSSVLRPMMPLALEDAAVGQRQAEAQVVLGGAQQAATA